MTFRRRLGILSLWALLLAPDVALLAQNDSEHPSFSGRLSPRPIDGRLRGQLTGIGEVTAVLEDQQLQVVCSFEGMQTPAVSATLRRGLAAGVAGPTLGQLNVTHGTSGIVSGSVPLNDSQIEFLGSGALYVQIDGEGAEDGTLWGFLIRQ
jgi:hypothetical protein